MVSLEPDRDLMIWFRIYPADGFRSPLRPVFGGAGRLRVMSEKIEADRKLAVGVGETNTMHMASLKEHFYFMIFQSSASASNSECRKNDEALS